MGFDSTIGFPSSPDLPTSGLICISPKKFFKYEKVFESNLFPHLPVDINTYNKENNNKKVFI